MCLGDQREAGAGFTLRVRSFYSGNLPQRDLFICPHLVVGKSLVNYRRSVVEELKPPSTAEAPEGNDPGCAAAQASDHILLVAFQLSTLCTHTHTLQAHSAFAFYPVWLSQGKMDARSRVLKPSSKRSNDTKAGGDQGSRLEPASTCWTLFLGSYRSPSASWSRR